MLSDIQVLSQKILLSDVVGRYGQGGMWCDNLQVDESIMSNMYLIIMLIASYLMCYGVDMIILFTPS